MKRTIRFVFLLSSMLAPAMVHAQPLPPAPVAVPAEPYRVPPDPLNGGPQVGLGAPQAIPQTSQPVPVAPPPGVIAPVIVPVVPIARAAQPPALFFDVELEFLDPIAKDHLHASVTRPNGEVVALSTDRTPLSWTLAPRFDIGYHLPDRQGDFIFGYRFFATEGTSSAVLQNGLIVNTKSRIDWNQFDFDYATCKVDLVPRLESQVRFGIRLASIYYDDQLDNPALQQCASNYYIGAGPHLEWDLNYRIMAIPILPGLSAFGKVDGAVLVGQTKQRFYDTQYAIDGSALDTADRTQHTQSVPSLAFQAGLGYTPPQAEYLHFRVGYQVERYWQIGHIGGSNFDLTTQGVFLRGEIDF